MKAFFFIAIILMPEKSFPRTPTINERVVDIAGIFVGVMEQGVNRHPFIDEWNRRLGIPLGSSYCATFISFILDMVGVVGSSPIAHQGKQRVQLGEHQIFPSVYRLQRQG